MDKREKTAILTRCRFCGQQNAVIVFSEDVEEFYKGKPVLECFPYLTPDERELIISGTCRECWDKHFGDEE